MANLLTANIFTQFDKKIRSPQITIVLRNFVFKNKMISIGIPSKIRNCSMILVSVISMMSKNKILG